jgi:hypothetical protein
VDTAIRVFDILTIAVALLLARSLRLRFFYAAFGLFVVLSVLRLHYGLQYSWAFLGRYGVNVAIPLVMAWAGNHLAAKSSDSPTEKRLWRALFVTLTVLALGGSFWALSQEDKNHKLELLALRGDIKADFTKVILQYNEAHPQHPITSEQYAEILNAFNTMHVAGSFTKQPERRCRFDDLKNCSPDELKTLTYRIAMGVKGIYLREKAYGREANQVMRRDYPNEENGPHWDAQRHLLKIGDAQLWDDYKDHYLNAVRKLRDELSETASELKNPSLDPWYAMHPAVPAAFVYQVREVANELTAMADMLDSKVSAPVDHVEKLSDLADRAQAGVRGCSAGWYARWASQVTTQVPFIKSSHGAPPFTVYLNGCNWLESNITELNSIIMAATKQQPTW